MHSGAAVPLGSARLACSRAAHDLGNLRFARHVLDCLAAAGLCTAGPPETQPDLFVETARHAIAIFEYGGVKLRRGCERLFRYVAHVDRRRRIGRPFWFKLFSSPSTFRARPSRFGAWASPGICLALGRREKSAQDVRAAIFTICCRFRHGLSGSHRHARDAGPKTELVLRERLGQDVGDRRA